MGKKCRDSKVRGKLERDALGFPNGDRNKILLRVCYLGWGTYHLSGRWWLIPEASFGPSTNMGILPATECISSNCTFQDGALYWSVISVDPL